MTARLLFVMTVVLPIAAQAGPRCLAIDGDTLVCDRQKVRLTNVYAAELDEPGGRIARQRMRALIASGEVALRPFGTDRYGRLLAEVYVNGRRIEQSDIGPRAGRGAGWERDRHMEPRSGLSNLVNPGQRKAGRVARSGSE